MNSPQNALLWGESDDLRNTMARLYAAGLTLIPLGGADGKKPLVGGWHARRRLPLETVLRIMRQHDSRMYGIRLDGLMVVDLDTDNEATRDYFASRFEPSPVTVLTSRGSHHYFKYDGPPISKVRERDIAIDFKSGKSAFVVGPGSVRPDNDRRYEPGTGSLATTALPAFVDKGPVSVTADISQSPKVPVGSRHDTLVKRAVEYAHCVDSYDDLLADLMALKDLEFEEAATVPDGEIISIAQWTWARRAEGNLYAGRNSVVKVNRLALDALQARRDGMAALSLYMLLLSEHGHHPGKVFAIAPDAIIAANRLSMHRNTMYRARDILVDECLLAVVRQGKGYNRRADQFRLVSPLVASALKERRKESKGGKSSITLVPPQGPGRGERSSIALVSAGSEACP